jgi:hypothetical protein
VDRVGGETTTEERPSAPSVLVLIYPYPYGSASGSSASEDGLPLPCSPEREGRRHRRLGGNGRREQESPPVGDREGVGYMGGGERGGAVKLEREYDM